MWEGRLELKDGLGTQVRGLVLKTKEDVLSLNIIDFGRPGTWYSNPIEALQGIAQWLTFSDDGGFIARWIEPNEWGIYQRDDFPGWTHGWGWSAGNQSPHVEIGEKFWNWFMSTSKDSNDYLHFQDSPDFMGVRNGQTFYGDIGQVSPTAFFWTLAAMREHDYWISLVDGGKTHILLHPLYPVADMMRVRTVEEWVDLLLNHSCHGWYMKNNLRKQQFCLPGF